jgi:hypothetical protein
MNKVDFRTKQLFEIYPQPGKVVKAFLLEFDIDIDVARRGLLLVCVTAEKTYLGDGKTFLQNAFLFGKSLQNLLFCHKNPSKVYRTKLYHNNSKGQKPCTKVHGFSGVTGQ